MTAAAAKTHQSEWTTLRLRVASDSVSHVRDVKPFPTRLECCAPHAPISRLLARLDKDAANSSLFIAAAEAKHGPCRSNSSRVESSDV